MNAREYKALFELEDHFWWFRGMRKITAAMLDPLVERGKQVILDAGCGTGFSLHWLRRYAPSGEAVGLDFSKEALDFTRRRGEKLLTQGSVTRLPFLSNTFDLVVSFEVLDSLSPELASAAFAELVRVLKPHGLLFIRLPAFQSLYSGHDRAVSTVHRYTRKELERCLNNQRLELMRLTYANALLLPGALVWRFVHRKPRSDVRPLPKSFRWMNSWLERVLALEAMWLRRPHWSLPVGLSVIGIGRKIS